MSRLKLFPHTTKIIHRKLTLNGLDLSTLADKFGTPLYIYDRETLDININIYREELKRSYAGEFDLTYAGKAFLCLALAEWVNQQGISLDCTGLGELTLAKAAGMKKMKIVFHGVNKSRADLEMGLSSAGVIVVDNLDELNQIVRLSQTREIPDLWFRYQPGQKVKTHAYTQTGYHGSKFGLCEREIILAAKVCKENGLNLRGLHFHLGSQFSDLRPLGNAVDAALDLAIEIQPQEGWVLSPGGGWGVPYHEDEIPYPPIQEYVEFLSNKVEDFCQKNHLPLPKLQPEPGRSIVAKAGIALYRVGAIKKNHGKTWVLVDGGLADNPRPAIYGTRYSALPVRDPERSPVTSVNIAGPYCESGDVMITSLPMPEMRVGDVVAVPVSGAYQLSMASNYNGARRPAVLWVEKGHHQMIRERESPEDLFRLDRRLVKPKGRE